MNLAVDLDSTLADIHGFILPFVSAELGEIIRLGQITDWNWLGDFVGIERAGEIYTRFWEYVKSPDDIKPTEPHLSETVGLIRQRVKSVDIVTAHPESCRPNITVWLHYYGIPFDKLVLSGSTSKGELAYDAYVDDNPLLPLEVPSGRTVFLYDQLWNRMIRPTDYPFIRVIRVYSIMDVLAVLRSENSEYSRWKQR